MQRCVLHLLGLLCLSLCSACFPNPDPYPHQTPEKILQEAQGWSDSLGRYITRWAEGRAAAQIPARLIPKGIVDCKNFYLKKPEDATPTETWATRPARQLKLDSIYNGLPDPNVTYLYLGTPLAPFGSKLVIEGEFPHARFFSFQFSPPLNGREYYAQRMLGSAEVSIVDADIEPLPGHINPYRVGANRNAPNRRYRLEVDLAKGDPLALNRGAHQHPYRGSQRRVAAMLSYQGPYGFKTLAQTPIQGGGPWDLGAVWVRIYAPDQNKGAYGGVPLPRVWFELPNGSRFFIGSDFSTLLKRANATTSARKTSTPLNPNFHAGVGWFKSWGIVRNIMIGACLVNGWSRAENIPKINAVDLGATGRGENQAAPGNYEPHASTNNYASYIGRSVVLPPGMVAVLTGVLPSFPATRNGEARMQVGQLRYWSICGYDNDPFSKLPGACVNALRDDELVLDAQRRYLIAYSRPADRPTNARRENGVSWVNWGPTQDLGLMIRYVSVGPEWTFEKAPHEGHLSWTRSDWAGSRYDSTLIGLNTHQGWMGAYQPKVHLMSKAEFEALGQRIDAGRLPSWVDEQPRSSFNIAQKKSVTASSQYTQKLPIPQPGNAVDGYVYTRWASSYGSKTPEWISVDLGQVQRINALKLIWGGFGQATQYQIQCSTDGINWTSTANQTKGNGGVDLFKNLNTQGRYVRVWMTRSALGYYALQELEVYN
jgi:hypothetical protein